MPLDRVKNHWSSTNALIGSKVFTSVHKLDTALSVFCLSLILKTHLDCYLSYTISVIEALKNSLHVLQNPEDRQIVRVLQQAPRQYKPIFPTSFNIQRLGNLKESCNLMTFSSLCLFILRTEWVFLLLLFCLCFFFLRQDGGLLKYKGKWKCALTNKIVFLNRDLGRQLLEIK